MLRSSGAQVDDVDAYYLWEGRVLTLWPFDKDGRSMGECIYAWMLPVAQAAKRKLRPEEIGRFDPATQP
jgi:hypothetical protein